MGNVVIFGAGGHGKVVADILEKKQKYKIVGFLDGGKSVDYVRFLFPRNGSSQNVIDKGKKQYGWKWGRPVGSAF